MNNIKVSLIVIIDFFKEENLRNCLNSIINQSLKDIEIICISNSPIPIVDDFYKRDKRIKKVVSNQNLKNMGLKYISGEYFSFINCNDWLDFDYCEKLYNKAYNNGSDIVLYKCLMYDDGKWYEDYFYNFFNFEDEFFDKTFSHKDIKDILFEIPQEVYNKFFKNNLNIDSDPFFEDNSIFEDSTFFFESMLSAEKISLLNEFIYFKRIEDNSDLINKDILINLIDLTNVIISIFVKLHNNDFYEKRLLNYKLDLIRYWYFCLVDSIQSISYEYLFNDFKSLKVNVDFDFSENILTKQNFLFYKMILQCNSADMFNISYENNKISERNEVLLSEYNKVNKRNEVLLSEYNKVSKCNEVLLNENNYLKDNINDLTMKIDTLEDTNIKLTNLVKNQNLTINRANESIYFLNNNIDFLNSKFSDSNSSRLIQLKANSIFNKIKK